jgi:hypothetical protein
MQTLMFPEAKERMAYECDAFTSDYLSAPVDRSKDIQAIASMPEVKQSVAKGWSGQGPHQKPVT